MCEMGEELALIRCEVLPGPVGTYQHALDRPERRHGEEMPLRPKSAPKLPEINVFPVRPHGHQGGVIRLDLCRPGRNPRLLHAREREAPLLVHRDTGHLKPLEYLA